MRFFYVANSNAAPFFSDTSTGFIEGDFVDADEALDVKRQTYGHPAGLFALRLYQSADAYHENPENFLAQWLSLRADVRTNGIECPTCGERTQVTVGNWDGTTDLHACPNGHEWRVDSNTGEGLGPYRPDRPDLIESRASDPGLD